MAITAKINVKDNDISAAIREFFISVLDTEDVRAIMIPQHLPMKKMVMPTLVTDPQKLETADPLAPCFPMNAARLVSRLTRKPFGGKILVVLRPCEIRAFYELVKLNQGSMDELVIAGVDCLGAYKNSDYLRFLKQHGDKATGIFYQNALNGKTEITEGIDISPACKSCENPIPEGADILIGLLGADINHHLMIQSQSPKGEAVLKRLNLSEAEEPSSRKEAVSALISKRSAYRDEMFSKTHEATDTLDKLNDYLANCVNCYNCRVACPVCYCKECVFVTDVFNHEPYQYIKWAKRKGMIKMPADTVFYHLTRLAHISAACVGCGQCSNACPNDIPLAELFRMVAWQTQKAFDYTAGKSLDEKPPLSVFREDEFQEIVGIK